MGTARINHLEDRVDYLEQELTEVKAHSAQLIERLKWLEQAHFKESSEKRLKAISNAMFADDIDLKVKR